ncbi:AAA family ATPase [Psychrobacter sp. NPDC078631]|uniref:AAA family ATPase n=1 Tax=Psychrobacter sp. NPDC078631 TaxID=3390666 RepID=UPI003D04B230
MRLKSLKLAGFKSFANPTTFTFRHGITAIVGPNGCGKSNVIDAIRWVLGETSAKQLRGGAMSDVIFAGTQDKTAKSVASVELTFEHTQDEQTGIRHEFNLYQELSVRRQVNKDGRSDYFINGTRCRRRDVVDVFLGTGLGARSYAVIEQGMIGRIVESSPVQLREFIEEAAGVSRYQARREETQKKLEKTKDNLARLHDMQSELLRQQKTLSKQAASAQRYEELALTLADIEQQLAIQQLYQAKQTHQQQKVAHEHSATEVSTLQADYDTLKDQQDKLTARINQEQWLKDDAQSAHYQQQLGYQQAEHQLSDAKSQLVTIEQQLSGLAQQREQSLADIERLNAEQAEQRQALEVLRPQLTELTDKRDNYKRNEQPLQRAWHEAQNNLSRLQDKARSLEQQQAINAQAQKRHQQSHDKCQRREQNWQNLWQQLQQSIAPSASDSTDMSKTDNAQDLSQVLEQQVTELNTHLQQVERQREAVDERLSEIQPQAHSLQQRLNAQQSELSDYEKRHALLAGEYDTLHQILHPKPTQQPQPQSEKIKATATDNVDSDGILNQPLAIATLRAQIELSAKGQEYAPLLDSILALWLDSHVLTSNPQANQQANQIKQSDVNNANDISQQANSLWQALEHDVADLLTYQTAQNTSATAKDKTLVETGHSLWLPTAQSAISENAFVSELPDSLIDKVLPLSQLITQPLLSLWQQCYIYTAQLETSEQHEVDTLTDVLKSLPPSAILLTVDGWLISRHGTINLSKFAGAQDEQNDSNSQFLTQRLQQRTRLQALEDLLDKFETKIQDQQKSIAKDQRDYDALLVSLEEARAQAEQLTRDKHKYQQQLTTERANAERLQADSQRLNADKATLEQEKQELAQEQQTIEQEQQHIESEIATLTPQIAEARATTQQLQAERSELNRARQADDDAWQALQLRIQQYEMRLEHSVSSLARATEQHDKSLENEQSLQTRHDQQQAKLPELQAALQSAQVTRDEQQVLLNERDTALMALKQTYAEQQTAFDTLQNTLQTQQSELARHATELALSAARLEDASAHTQSALDAYYCVSHKYKAQAEQPQQSMSVSNLLADFIAHDRRVRPDKIAELESERAKLTQQLSKIGPVNLAAVAELAEVNERLEPLAQQTADIAASMQTLTEAIASIDETTKTLFMQTLDAVNNELANLFAKVFGGGQASLTLNTDEMPANTPKSEQWRAGLTLMAQPKGKRNSRLAVLSGGEKTLTALSLIFAIFKQHPAPFCVLDEVDAPLDDANVARFTSLIHELADDLQFVFISHNKLTMQIADELKGITMPSAGISTLVSVSLDEAARYVES